MRDFVKVWSKVIFDKFILTSILGYKLKFDTLPRQFKANRNSSLNVKDEKHMQKVIDNLLELGAIQRCVPCRDQFVSYFLVPKSNGEQRFVLNLKDLNEFILTNHFKMEDIRTAVKLMNKGWYMASLDLRDAYYSIPICEESRKYLRFMWKEWVF